MGVLSILEQIQDRLSSISRSISKLTGKSLFPINPYQLTLSTTLSSYRPPYRKIPINPYHFSSRHLKNHAHNPSRITHPSHSIPINSPNQSIPFNHPSSSTTIAPHSPHQNLNVFLA